MVYDMMAVRFIKKVESSRVVIDNLEQFAGSEVEIIVMPFTHDNASKPAEPRDLSGILNRYAAPAKHSLEKAAWSEAVRVKHGIR